MPTPIMIPPVPPETYASLSIGYIECTIRNPIPSAAVIQPDTTTSLFNQFPSNKFTGLLSWSCFALLFLYLTFHIIFYVFQRYKLVTNILSSANFLQ